jgi:steroid 5-alpha reductase family enzyme
MEPFLLSAFCIFCFMCLLFMIAQVKQDNGIVDGGWGIGFVLVAALTLSQYGHYYPKQKLTMFLVALWGLRLASYIIIRNWDKPEDFRYAKWRQEWGDKFIVRSFLQVFMLQGVIMFITCLPVIVINSTGHTRSLASLYPVGAGVWLLGFCFESIADHQMFFFKENPNNSGKVMNKGLWKYSRHPNYFGEALQWWGIFIISIPSGMWYVSALSPLTITFLLLKVSGVTMLEKKYEGNDKYEEYKSKTNAFIPWLPKA